MKKRESGKEEEEAYIKRDKLKFGKFNSTRG